MKKTPKKRTRRAIKHESVLDAPQESKTTKMDEFELTLRVAGIESKSKGSTIEEALDGLKKPAKVIGKGEFIIRKNQKTQTRLMMPLQIKRLFYPIARKVLYKQLVVGL